MELIYFFVLLLCSGILAVPLDTNKDDQVLNRSIRSPIFKKKPLGHLLGLGGGIGGGGYGGGVNGGHEGGNYITNINNYGPSHQPYNPHVTGGQEHGAGSFAGSAAIAGGHGGSQSQSASFALGPYTASFSQSQAQGGFGKNRFDAYSDY